MVHHMEQRAECAPVTAETQSQRHDARVFDTRVRQHAFVIALRDEKCGGKPERQQPEAHEPG